MPPHAYLSRNSPGTGPVGVSALSSASGEVPKGGQFSQLEWAVGALGAGISGLSGFVFVRFVCPLYPKRPSVLCLLQSFCALFLLAISMPGACFPYRQRPVGSHGRSLLPGQLNSHIVFSWNRMLVSVGSGAPCLISRASSLEPTL